jgi:hypothetical protein
MNNDFNRIKGILVIYLKKPWVAQITGYNPDTYWYIKLFLPKKQKSAGEFPVKGYE